MNQLTAAVRTGESLSDAEVIEQSLATAERFVTIYDRHANRIHRYLRRRFDEALAQDLAAETFAAAFAQRDRFDRSRSDAAPWLFGIASNLAARHRRREAAGLRAIARGGGVAVFDSVDDLVERVDSAALAKPLAAALAALPIAQRDALAMHAWGELSYEEIAVAMSVPVGTVRSRISRGRAALRQSLAAAGFSGFCDEPEEAE